MFAPCHPHGPSSRRPCRQGWTGSSNPSASNYTMVELLGLEGRAAGLTPTQHPSSSAATWGHRVSDGRVQFLGFWGTSWLLGAARTLQMLSLACLSPPLHAGYGCNHCSPASARASAPGRWASQSNQVRSHAQLGSTGRPVLPVTSQAGQDEGPSSPKPLA